MHGPDSNAQAQVSDNGDGKYPVVYTVTKPGDYTVTIKLRFLHAHPKPETSVYYSFLFPISIGMSTLRTRHTT